MTGFYEQTGDDEFVATEHTRGPWDPGAQHAGPPSALLGRAVEGRDGMRVARVSVDLRRPVPIGPVRVSTRVLRESAETAVVAAELISGGDTVMWATALLVRTSGEVPDAAGLPFPPGPEQGESRPFFPVGNATGYHTAMEWRFVQGGFRELGPATCWLRMGMPLVPGEQPSPLVRTLVAADCGNGVSGVVDWRTHTFVNADYTVHLHRYPVGDWVGLEARTSIKDGIGVADTVLFDVDGGIGRALQSLVVAPRAQG